MRLRGRLFTSRRFLRTCELAAPIGFLAVLAGWTVTEVGRQPWTVYGLLRTANSVSPSLTGVDVAVSFAGYAIVYLIMYPVGIRHMIRIVQRGPAVPATEPEPIESGRPEGPIHALHGSEPAVAAALDAGASGRPPDRGERGPGGR
jgi:cytochrome d ubiquinol oxidase subunit I